uniref:Uncharacterized protein n=1 Tax=Glyptapanteles flavicoxis TaxID=463051 RepID=B7S8P4_9HYME|nr:hypothetical protein GFP_L5_0170 [Glyptapanteles flavicoxis]
MEIFVDFEGYHTLDGSFIIKELAVVELNDDPDILSSAALAIFEPPAEYINEVLVFQTKDYWSRNHGISWNEGSFSYADLNDVLCETLKHHSYVYVLGEEKQQWIRRFINFELDISDLTKMRFINELKVFDPLQPCLLRKKHSKQSDYGCAYESVQKMKRWFISCWGINPSLEKSLQIFYQLQTLIRMDPRDIACLDESFILQFTKHEINEVWSKLPEHMKTDPRFIDYTRCTDHYCTICEDVLEGPYPWRKDCFECNRIS